MVVSKTLETLCNALLKVFLFRFIEVATKLKTLLLILYVPQNKNYPRH